MQKGKKSPAGSVWEGKQRNTCLSAGAPAANHTLPSALYLVSFRTFIRCFKASILAGRFNPFFVQFSVNRLIFMQNKLEMESGMKDRD